MAERLIIQAPDSVRADRHTRINLVGAYKKGTSSRHVERLVVKITCNLTVRGQRAEYSLNSKESKLSLNGELHYGNCLTIDVGAINHEHVPVCVCVMCS